MKLSIVNKDDYMSLYSNDIPCCLCEERIKDNEDITSRRSGSIRKCVLKKRISAPNQKNYSIASILETINAIRTPKIPMNANENRKLDNSAM